MTLDPNTVDEDLVVARIAGVHALPLGDGRALLDRDAGAFLVVSPTGALVWECLDGSSSLNDICRDLAEVLHAPFPTVLADTLALVRRMAERGLVRAERDASSALSVAQRIARGDRTPGARRDFDFEPWGAITVRSDDRLLGLGVSDRGLFELARAAVVPERLAGDGGTPDLRLIVNAARGAIPGMHALYRDGRCVLRATGEGRMVRAALLHLAALANEPEGTVRVRGRVIVGRDGVTLVVGTHLEILDHASPRLGRLRLRVLDVPGAVVDVDTVEVVIPEPPDFLEPRGLTEIDRRFPRAQSEEPVRPGRYEIRNLVAVGMFGSDDQPGDPASTLQALLALLAGPGEAWPRDDLASVVARLIEQAPPLWLYGRDDRELMGVLQRLAG